MTEYSDDVRQVAEIVDRARFGMLTTTTSGGERVSRPMTVQETEFDGDLWFFGYGGSPLVAQIQADPQVNVAFSNTEQGEWLSISGTASVLNDRAKAEELWSPQLQVWFPDGLETPDLVLIHVHADSAEYWESPSSKVKRLIGAARAAATGDPDKFPGHSEEVSL